MTGRWVPFGAPHVYPMPKELFYIILQPEEAIKYEDLPAVDRYALWKLSAVMTEVRDSYESFQFYKFYQVQK